MQSDAAKKRGKRKRKKGKDKARIFIHAAVVSPDFYAPSNSGQKINEARPTLNVFQIRGCYS